MENKKINYQTDFEATLTLLDASGKDIGFPDYDWRAEFYTTNSANRYIASYINGEYVNCYNKDNKIVIVFDNHHLGTGDLNVKFFALLPNSDYPDESQQVVTPSALAVTLVRYVSELPTDTEVEVLLPMLYMTAYDEAVRNGYEGTKEEYYTALSILPSTLKTAQTKIDDITTLENNVESAETSRVEVEKQRVLAESDRATAEQERVNAENSRVEVEKQRVAAENDRVTAEDKRVEAENSRVSAEQERATAESDRATAENSRAEVEKQRVLAENDRVSAETKRVDAEQERADAERKRVDAETSRVSAENSRVSAETKRVDAEASRVSAETARATAESKRATAESDRASAETARAKAEQGRVDAETTRVTAEKTREADFATAKSNAEKAAEYATEQGDYAKKQADNIAVVDNKIEELLKHLGKYGDIAHEEITLKTAVTGYAINTDGQKITKSGYAMSESFALTQGNIYLIKAAAVSKEVSLFARVSLEPHTDIINYNYTYNDDGTIATATPTYDTSLVYQYNYSYGEDDTATLESIMLGDSAVSELPTIRNYDVEVYNPLFKTGAIATPLSGFYVYFCPTSMDIVVSAQASDLQQSDSDEYKGKMFGERYGVFASIASNYVNRWERDELDDRITAIENSLAYKNFLQDDFCVKAWATDNLSASSIESYGQEQFLWDLWRFYLIDTTDNAGITTTPVGELVRDNLFRFTRDNSFAPSVGISETQYADSELELFQLVDGEYVQYCEAGAYDAEDYLENVLRPVVEKTPNNLAKAKLYKLVDEEYVEAHAVLPWETTETKYSINLGNYRDIYALDNTVGDSGKTWIGLFSNPTKWDGIDVSKYKLPPTAISPSPVTVVNDTYATSFFFAYSVGWKNCGNVNGVDGSNWGLSGAAFPRRWDMQQITNMGFARKCNADTTKPYPCAEGGFFAFNCAMNSMEVAMGTKYLHSTARFSTGISSNDSCSNESQMNTYGGFRCRVSGAETWTYSKWNGTPPIRYNNANTSKTATTLVNNESPKERCMESQMAYSWAKEFGISENVEFEFYGYTYWYRNVSTAASGKMNAIVYSRRSGTKTLWNSSKEETTWDWEFVLRMGLYMGLRLSGDVYCYRGGGYEQVGEYKSGNSNEPIRLFMQPDQTKWVRESSVNIAGKFSFEDVYPLEGTVIRQSEGWTKKRQPNAAFAVSKGGSTSTGECYYCSSNHYWSGSLTTPYVRIAARCGGHANLTNCSPRILAANFSVTIAAAYNCGSAQFLINVS
jgi:hypothetical protein